MIGISIRRKAKMTKAIPMIRFELWPGVTAPQREAFCPTRSRRSWTKLRRIITLRSSSSPPSGSSHPVMSVVLWKSGSPPLAWCCLSSCPNRLCHSTTKFLSCWTIVNDEKYEYYKKRCHCNWLWKVVLNIYNQSLPSLWRPSSLSPICNWSESRTDISVTGLIDLSGGLFDPTRPFIDDNFVSLTICQNAICLLKLCSCNSCSVKQENRYKSVQMVDRCLWMTRWSILKPFLAFVATALVLLRLVFMTIRWRDTAVKEIFLAKWSK